METNSPLEYLRHSQETINQAISMARKIQQLELSGQMTLLMMNQLSTDIQEAIRLGKKAVSDYKYSLQKLKLASSKPNIIPVGF